ncbi:MAG: sulfatase, partial [Candidatus Neomarinimicrobiota bacterium]
MSKRYATLFLFVLVVFLLFAKCITGVKASELKQQKLENNYNIIFIAINVLRPDHLGCYGYHRNTSPAIDKLAEESFVFKNAFAQAGYTLPNMMSIITSLYPKSHGVLEESKDKLSSSVYTMAEVIKNYEYKTAWFSVLKEPHLDIDIGFGRGYDYKGELSISFEGKEKLLSWIMENKDNQFFLALNTRHTHTPYFPLPDYINAFKSGKKGTIFDNREDYHKAVYYDILQEINTPGTVLNNIYDEIAIAMINDLKKITVYNEQNRKNMWLTKIQKIADLTPPQKLYRLGQIGVETYNSTIDLSNKENLEYLISLYDACILGVDQELIRPIISTLKELNIYDNTMIVITGDHGESLGEHGILGHGHDYFGQVIHVPLIIKLPNSETNKEVMGLVQSIDLLPTIFDMLGVKIPSYVQGKSLLPMIQDVTTNTVNEFIYGQNRTLAYLRSTRWKLIVDRSDLNKESSNKDKLFHIRDDPN